MATSKSGSHGATWAAGASVFSGRPDPVWELKPAVGVKLEKIWRALKPDKVEPPPSPSLGYRGCFLRAARGREWFAFGGVVTLRSGHRTESRRDPGKKFERTLLSSAPAVLLPPWLDT